MSEAPAAAPAEEKKEGEGKFRFWCAPKQQGLQLSTSSHP